MVKLPVLSGLKAVKAFNKAGWVVSRQTGSHIIMEKAGYAATLSVPKRLSNNSKLGKKERHIVLKIRKEAKISVLKTIA